MERNLTREEHLFELYHKLSDEVLGKNYYNMGMDSWQCNRMTAEDIIWKNKKNIAHIKALTAGLWVCSTLTALCCGITIHLLMKG